MRRKTTWTLLGFLLSGGFLLGGGRAEAHSFAPAVLEIAEMEPGTARVRWKQPAQRPSGGELRPVLPAACEHMGEVQASKVGTGVELRWEVRCGRSLAGQTVEVQGIAESSASVLLRVALADGRSMRVLLDPNRSTFVVPERESRLEVLRGYGRLGIEHILSGWDHLLFVLGLVLLVGGGRRLLWTVTAFTVGHSVTLALAVLGVVHVPQEPIEAGIALSIFVLGVELARGEGERSSVLRRIPWFMAGLFGLLHGLGFAGALTEVGLPQGEIPLALFAFNVGIELGQLAFVAVALLVWRLLRIVPIAWPAWVIRAPAYGIATLAVFWFLERATASVPPGFLRDVAAGLV